MSKTSLILLALLAILAMGCANPKAEFFGMKVEKAVPEAFSINPRNPQTARFTYDYKSTTANPNIIAYARVRVLTGTLLIDVCNNGSLPLKSNYFLDQFSILTHDLKWHDLEKPDILYYPKNTINPSNRTTFDLKFFGKKGDIKLILVRLGGTDLLLLKPIPDQNPDGNSPVENTSNPDNL